MADLSRFHRGLLSKPHPSVDLIIHYANLHVKKVLSLVVCVISLCFFLVLIFQGVKFAYFVRFQVTPALSISRWLVYSMIPVSGCVFLVHGLKTLFSLIQDFHHDN